MYVCIWWPHYCWSVRYLLLETDDWFTPFNWWKLVEWNSAVISSTLCNNVQLFQLTISAFNGVDPYFQYCIIVWGSTYPTNLNRLILLQERIVRIVNKKPFDAHTDPLFIDLKFLKFVDIYSLHLGKLMYSYNNNLLPPSFSNFFFTYESGS